MPRKEYTVVGIGATSAYGGPLNERVDINLALKNSRGRSGALDDARITLTRTQAALLQMRIKEALDRR